MNSWRAIIIDHGTGEERRGERERYQKSPEFISYCKISSHGDISSIKGLSKSREKWRVNDVLYQKVAANYRIFVCAPVEQIPGKILL